MGGSDPWYTFNPVIALKTQMCVFLICQNITTKGQAITRLTTVTVLQMLLGNCFREYVHHH